jgi:RNA polymerase sigma-70 factor (ECF subfamily)
MLQNCEEKDILKIIDKHSNMIYRLCFVYLKNKFDAEDAYQDIFVKIFERAPEFLNDEHEKAWIIKVTSNHCKNILRYNAIKKHVLIDESITASETINEDDTIKQILKLPLQYRSVLYLYYYEGYSSKEIAGILKKRDATIRTWLKRARERLKDLIGGDCNEKNI